MTHIRLYHGVRSEEAALVNILTKQVLEGKMRAVVVVKDEYAANDLDKRLWVYDDTSFLPHCQLAAKEADDTPVLIAHAAQLDKAPVVEVMVALGGAVPEESTSYENLVLIVKDSIGDRPEIEERLGELERRGHKCDRHDMSKPRPGR